MTNHQSAEQPKRSDAAIANKPAAQPKQNEAATNHQSAEQPKQSDAAIAKQDCDLCEAARFTHWYFEDDTCWIADCEVCSVPMVVWKPHGTDPATSERDHMLAQLRVAGSKRFGGEPFDVDTDMRTIPDHWHAHARDADWHRLRMARPLSRFTGVGSERVERT